MIVKPCPKECVFDWKRFHRDLDIAMAHMIDEIEGFLPSQNDIMVLAEFSNKKRKFQERGKK